MRITTHHFFSITIFTKSIYPISTRIIFRKLVTGKTLPHSIHFLNNYRLQLTHLPSLHQNNSLNFHRDMNLV